MSEDFKNPYQAPQSDLVNYQDVRGITNFKRFSVWGALGLTIITLGIYSVYWLYTRAQVINRIHADKIPMIWLKALVIMTVLSLATEFSDQTIELQILGIGIIVIYMIFFLGSLFKVRNRLRDIMNRGEKSVYTVGPLMTFFFFNIYLQYKINECIDAEVSGSA